MTISSAPSPCPHCGRSDILLDVPACCEDFENCLQPCTQRGYREQHKADVALLLAHMDWAAADFLKSKGPDND